MDEQTLERLMIDRAVGELDGDVAALLDAYLARDRGRRAMADRIEQTLGLVRDLDGPARREAAPALARPRVERAYRIGGRRRAAMPWIGAAAGIALGVVVGMGLSGGGGGAVSDPSSGGVQPMVVTVVQGSRDSEGGGWTLGRLMEAYRQDRGGRWDGG